MKVFGEYGVFENYDVASRHYDDTRKPIGVELILGCLARQRKPLKELVVLDAGCGTGAYSQAIIDDVDRIEALDQSRGMLSAAIAKLHREEEQGRIQFHHGSITDLPCKDEAFDAVMVNQVVHHLSDDANKGYPLHRRVIREFARVLRRGGALVLNHATHEQLRGYWDLSLLPRVADQYLSRFIPLDSLRPIIGDAGFAYAGSFVPIDAVYQGEAYFDGRGPLKKAWRDGNSMWAMASDDDLSQALARIRELDAAGTLDAYVAEHDARRQHIGQFTFLFATRT